MEQKVFTCSNDKFSKVISVLLLLFAVFLILTPRLFTLQPDEETAKTVLPVLGILLLILCGIFFLYTPVRYTISGQGIKVERRMGALFIPNSEIRTVRLPIEKELSFPVRTFGNGGLFGYTGRYYTKHIGSMIWQCTRRDRQIIVERFNKLPLIISPDEPEKFVWTATGTDRSGAQRITK